MKNTDFDDFRARLSLHLGDRGVSLRKASISVGFSENYLHQIIKMKKEPTLPALVKISRLTGQTLDELVFGETADNGAFFGASQLSAGSRAKSVLELLHDIQWEALSAKDFFGVDVFIKRWVDSGANIDAFGDVLDYLLIYRAPGPHGGPPRLERVGCKSLLALKSKVQDTSGGQKLIETLDETVRGWAAFSDYDLAAERGMCVSIINVLDTATLDLEPSSVSSFSYIRLLLRVHLPDARSAKRILCYCLPVPFFEG